MSSHTPPTPHNSTFLFNSHFFLQLYSSDTLHTSHLMYTQVSSEILFLLILVPNQLSIHRTFALFCFLLFWRQALTLQTRPGPPAKCGNYKHKEKDQVLQEMETKNPQKPSPAFVHHIFKSNLTPTKGIQFIHILITETNEIVSIISLFFPTGLCPLLFLLLFFRMFFKTFTFLH